MGTLPLHRWMFRLAIFIAMVLPLLYVFTHQPKPSRDAPVAQGTLMQGRAGHVTKIVKHVSQAYGRADEPPDDCPYAMVHYPSQVGPLVAYLTPDPGDSVRRPAVVWAHGGFGGISGYVFEPKEPDNDQTPQAFVDAGFVVMLPSWRGENDNPGRFELFYGEVDDALAAIDYVSKLPYVDPKRVYMAGHSTGGTVTLLAALAGDGQKIRAAFSFGGAPDMERMIRLGGYGNTPFDRRDPLEAQLRSPTLFVRSLRTPTWYFEGSGEMYTSDALEMQAEARRAATPFTAFGLDGGDHRNYLRAMTRLIARAIAADTGTTVNIDLSEPKVRAAWEEARRELSAAAAAMAQ